MRYYIALAIAVTIFTVPWLAVNYPEQADYILAGMKQIGGQLAAVIVHKPRTVADLQNKYAIETQNGVNNGANKIRVILVPGHEPYYGGAEFGDLKEREMNVELAKSLAGFLGANSKYEVVVARDYSAWNPLLENYFKNSWDSIVEWQKAHKEETLRRVSIMAPLPAPKVYHNSAPNDVAYRLYGITKWSNENNIDIAIHIHFNDHPGHGWKVSGKYSGFAIYSPEQQYANSTTTRTISQAIFKRLQKYNPVSDLPGESDGIIEERELIAIGANNTADAASLLVEYGYIYEPQFTNAEVRSLAIRDLAFQTYLGLEDFFNPNGSKTLASIYDTLVLPHTWNGAILDDSKTTKDVYALQTALLIDGLYPPSSKSKNDCPRTGKIGVCTRASIELFQNKYKINEKGVGQKTIGELNNLYGLKTI